MNMFRESLIITACIAIVVFVGDELSSKYNTDAISLSCINDGVEKSLLSVTTDDLRTELSDKGYILEAAILRENTTTEDRKFTVSGKSVFQCNTSLELTLKAKADNKEGLELIQRVSKGKSAFIVSVDRDYKAVENDLGTQFWVYAMPILESDVTSKF